MLAAGPYPFFRRSPLELVITPYLPSANAVEAAADYRKVPGVQAGDAVLIQLLDATGKKVLHERHATVSMNTMQTAQDLPASGLVAGVYTVRCVLKDAAGKTKADRQETYTLPAIPAWWGNKSGIPEATDMVPEPWTPVKKTRQGFEVWNRKIELGDALQPVQILNGSTGLLTKPARLEMALDGLAWDKPKTITKKKTGLVYRQAFRGKGAPAISR
jgi:hypothetical protein